MQKERDYRKKKQKLMDGKLETAIKSEERIYDRKN